MKALLLCAGYATRLYPLTENKPKPLLDVAGKPIIEYILHDIAKIDTVDTVYIVTNGKFASHFEEWKRSFQYHIPIIVVNDKTTSNDDRLGAIGDMHYTIQEHQINDDMLVVAGDNVFELNINEYINFAQKKRPYGTIAVYDVKDTELAKRYGLVTLDDDHRVIDFQEKPEHPQTTLASLALYFFPQETRELMSEYIEGGNNPDQPGRYVAWLSKHHRVYAYTFDGAWFDVGTVDSLEHADRFYRNKQ